MSYFNRKHIINYTKRKKSMKLQIKSFIAIAILSGVIATGCSGNKKNSADVAESTTLKTMADADIRGQWYIENIVFNDSDYVRPDETMHSLRQYIILKTAHISSRQTATQSRGLTPLQVIQSLLATEQ